MNLGLDIDGTITACPEFFRLLTHAVAADGGRVHIVSSRTRDEDVQRKTEAELRALGIVFHELHLLPSAEEARRVCPHKNLDWYQQYIWQKVDYCQRNHVQVFFDDEAKVIDLFTRLAPGIHVFAASVVNGSGALDSHLKPYRQSSAA